MKVGPSQPGDQTHAWLENIRTFREQLDGVRAIFNVEPERALTMICETKKLVLETPQLPGSQIDQYLSTIASAEQRMGLWESAEGTIRGMSQDLFHKVYELIKLADHYSSEKKYAKVQEILFEAQRTMPNVFNHEAQASGFMTPSDLEVMGAQLKERMAALFEPRH